MTQAPPNLEVDYRLQVPVVRRPSYTISLSQPNADMTIVHCELHAPWTQFVKRALRQDWVSLKAIHGCPLYALHTPPDLKHHKFLTMFGMVPHHRYVDALSGLPTIIYKTKDAE